MSILIKGMEMPTSCLACPCSGTGYTDDGKEGWICEANNLHWLTMEEKIDLRPEWCLLVPVPPHGRLIDADAVQETVLKLIEDGWDITRNDYKRMCDILYECPTIIEAEGEE